MSGLLPDIIRVVLLVLSASSFAPQVLRILSRRDCVGISASYIFFNLVAATQQFAIQLHFIAFQDTLIDGIIHSPPTAGDWLNLAQFVVVLTGHLVLFCLYLFLTPRRTGVKVATVIIYVVYLLPTVGFAIYETLPPPPSFGIPIPDREWVGMAWMYFQINYFYPAVNALVFLSLFLQLQELRRRAYDPVALSVSGLALQAVVFVLVAFGWPFRYDLPWGGPLSFWYWLDLWAFGSNALFALVQGVLWHATRQQEAEVSQHGETEPLIGAQG